MSDSFDPYLTWLGIRDPKRPVNYYRLLGLDIFEDEAEVIARAAQRQTQHVKTFADGPQSKLCQRVLFELKEAAECLSDPKLRAEYDRNLKGRVEPSETRETLAPKIVTQSEAPALPQVQTENNTAASSIGRPAIKARPPRKKKNNMLTDVGGWILGGVGAVVFAYVLINTDLIDRIRGKRPVVAETRPVVEEPNKEEVRKPDPKPAPVAESKDSQPGSAVKQTPPAKTKKKRNNSKNRKKSPKASEKKTTTAPPPKAPIPDNKLVVAARKKIISQYQAQFGSADIRAKRMLAQTLLTNANNRESERDMQFGLLELSAKLAAEAGALDTVMAAQEKMNRSFEIEFWNRTKPLVMSAISIGIDRENGRSGLIRVFETASQQRQFALVAEFSNHAAKMARKHGDVLQQKMLVQYARDMKELEVLRKKNEGLTNLVANAQNAKDCLSRGKYLCFAEDDWGQGIPFLINGSDRMLASIAKQDLEASQEANNDQVLQVADAWFGLSEKSKYKGADQRFMLRRAEDHYREALATKAAPQQQLNSKLTLIKAKTQIVKQFVDFPRVISAKTFVFDVQGPANFDSAQFERGTVLRLGLNRQTRVLPARKTAGVYHATTQDRRTQFEIRLMDSGYLEMRLFDAASGALLNILYGQ